MKKKISLLLCIIIASLCFAGCSNSEKAVGADDTETMKQVAELIVTTFSDDAETVETFKSLSDFALHYQLMYLPINAENFPAMIKSWEAAEEECGEYVSHGDYTVESKSDGYTVSTQVEFQTKKATLLFSFDEEMILESMDVSPEISTGEILKKAGLNTVLGMGVVFAVLIFLAFLISLIQYIPALLGLEGKKEKNAEPVVVPDAEEVAQITKQYEEEIAQLTELATDFELVAVITAAIAAQEGTGTDGFVVRSIRRRPSNYWK